MLAENIISKNVVLFLILLIIFLGPLHYCKFCSMAFISGDFLQKHLKKCVLTQIRNIDFKIISKFFQQYKYISKISPNVDIQIPMKQYQYHRCEVCSKDFGSKRSLDNHIYTHKEINKIKCIFCPKEFFNKHALNVHLVIHTGATPFKCDYCQKHFTQQATLKTHLLTHSGERTFQCPQCRRCYSQSSTLYRHIRQYHSGIEPYACSFCSHKFKELSNLKRHIGAKHSEESQKPNVLKCTHCESQFNYYIELTHHLMQAHQIDMELEDGKMECHRCNILFAHKRTFKRHMENMHKIKTRDKNDRQTYTCEKC